MELLYVFPPKLQSRGGERSTSVQLNTMLWDAADEDHRAASEMQPTFSPGLTEEVELRAGMNKKDHLLGGAWEVQHCPGHLLLTHNWPNSY